MKTKNNPEEIKKVELTFKGEKQDIKNALEIMAGAFKFVSDQEEDPVEKAEEILDKVKRDPREWKIEIFLNTIDVLHLLSSELGYQFNCDEDGDETIFSFVVPSKDVEI